MCCLLVSGFLTEITQQIHSLRASGVMSSHFARAAGSEMRTLRKSAGTLCTAPGEIALLAMHFILYRHLRCCSASGHDESVEFFSLAKCYLPEALPNPQRIGCPPDSNLRRTAG